MNTEYNKLYLENKLEITYFEFILLVAVHENESEILRDSYSKDFMNFTRMIKNLEAYLYVKWHGTNPDDISLRKKAEDLFKKLSKTGNGKKISSVPPVQQWIDSWRNIFPEGVNNAGYRYRGNKLEVLKKMTKFVTLYPEYSLEEIFTATKRYVERFSIRGYNYMQQAHYFIEKKDVGSALASECENLKETKSEKQSPNYGGKIV